MPRVVLKGWEPGLDKVALTKALRHRTGMSLAEAHAHVGRLLAGEEVSLGLVDPDAAAHLAAEASKVGAAVEVRHPAVQPH